MNTLFSLIIRGGPVMVPIVLLSILTIATGLERAWFWFQLFRQEDKVVHDVLDAARFDLERAMAIAEQSQSNPMGRFLLAPLRLRQPTPETFRLAMEAAADKEFVQMKKGDKFLETVVAVSPLLGLLGTVTGLIATFGNLNIGGGGTTEQATQAAAGIGEALITTAAGMVVAIMALVIYRLFVTFQAQQMNYFSDVGSELELVYRQVWYESAVDQEEPSYAAAGTGSNLAER
jgi:biopolymer transport protein ExbB